MSDPPTGTGSLMAMPSGIRSWSLDRSASPVHSPGLAAGRRHSTNYQEFLVMAGKSDPLHLLSLKDVGSILATWKGAVVKASSTDRFPIAMVAQSFHGHLIHLLPQFAGMIENDLTWLVSSIRSCPSNHIL